jgi:hypothetical protein
MAKKIGLLDDVLGRLTDTKRRRWIDGVPADLRVELGQVKEQFRGGLMGKTTAHGLCNLLVQSLAARGIQVHEATLSRWLKD